MISRLTAQSKRRKTGKIDLTKIIKIQEDLLPLNLQNKPENEMSFFSNINKLFMPKTVLRSLKLFAVLGAMCTLFACTDDLHLNNGVIEGEDFTGITLYIPDVEAAAEYGATRGDGNGKTRAYDTSKESNFNTLYIVAIEEKEGSEVLHTFYKSQYDRIDGDYKVYSIGLSPGDYKFYVVANLNRYLFTSSGADSTFPTEATSEEKIRSLILNFSSDIPLEPGFLPMACLHENIQVGNTSTNTKEKVESVNSTIEITENNSKRIYADLNYLCAKVRYTILFDRSKAPEFGSSDIIDMHRDVSTLATPYATNLRHRTPINPDVKLEDRIEVSDSQENTGSPEAIAGDSQTSMQNSSYFINDINNKEASWPIPLARYNYDVKINDSNDPFNFYDETQSDENIKAALDGLVPWTTGTWTAGEYLNKRAWQGITYLPENLITEKDSQSELFTILGFPYSFNSRPSDEPKNMVLDWEHEDNGNNHEYGIKRAKSYDVIALIKTPDPADMVVKVMVEDWTLQQLAYDLHGPYELIVENSIVPLVSMEEEATFWFRSDIDPMDIELVSPQVSVSQHVGTDMQPLFVGGVMKDSKGDYILNENGDYMFHVALNTEIPYTIIDGLNRNGILYTYKDENNEETTVKYVKEDISFFHIKAGSLLKRIEIKELNLDPYLKVTPQTIIIDTRERYTSGEDDPFFDILFETNVNPGHDGVSLTMTDVKALSGGIEDALFLTNPKNYRSLGNNTFDLTDQSGDFILNCFNIITGNEFWNKNSEFELKFTLTVQREGDTDPLIVEKTVVIKVRPFSGNFTIHFRDNTKPWMEPHIYIFQDLTLPNDMEVQNENGDWVPYEYAGKIVGFVEDNPSSGWQWNAAVQYVFSNNLSFRGWYGNHRAKKKTDGTYESEPGNEYGGPQINDPWEKATWTDTYQDMSSSTLNSTMGFVMFGEVDNSQSYEGRQRSLWNYKYSYTNVDKIPPELNQDKWQRYNFNVNFNSDHETSWDLWGCGSCQGLSPYYNKNGERFYTGISMEREDDGWWKYTLTGVAQPGRTVIIFANWHEPWMEIQRDYRAEDYRWPGDYEAGIPLFDFEDNDGWFLFDGNTTNADQKFTDERPITKELPHVFSSAHSQLKIEIVNPSNANIEKIEIGHKKKYLGQDNEPYNWSSYDGVVTDWNNKIISHNYNPDYTIQNPQLIDENGKKYLSINLPAAAYGYENLIVRIYTTSSNYKEYTLLPCFFEKSGTGYKSAQPLYLEFTEDIRLFVKWNDIVKLKADWGGDYAYYQPPTNGSDYLSLYWGGNTGSPLKTVKFEKEYGNYKYKIFNLSEAGNAGVNAKDKVSLRLCTDDKGNGNYYKILKVEDLPQYYNPEYKYYQINWHMLAKP